MHAIWSEAAGFLAQNWQELVGSLTGALCVWLLVKQNIWNWPIGITNNIFYIIIFYKSGLYADAGLQFVYIAISIYGWWNWLHGGLQHGRAESEHALPPAGVAWLSWDGRGGDGGSVLAAPPLYAQHRPVCRRPDHRALPDRAIHDVTQVVQNWWFWIVGDVLVIGLYIYKHLYLTSVLYAVFLAMCIAGLVEWQKASRRVAVVAA